MTRSRLPLPSPGPAALMLAVGALLLSSAGAAEGPAAQAPVPQPAPGVERSVVTVFATVRRPEPLKPWSKQAPSEVTGSGVIIEGQRILTAAHVVRYASQIQVQANQSGNKVAASVVAVAQGIDLAVLKLDDETFFEGRPPLTRASTLPDVKEPVMAYGFATGGASLSITKGIVSRIEFVPYQQFASGLRIQIDAAINPGNSGGPAMAGDKMIGLAFGIFTKAQNIGYIVPTEEIELFLRDVAEGRRDGGKPALFDELQTLENPALRSYLKLPASVEGIVVGEPYARDSGTTPLRRWDVITHIGEVAIDNQGKIKLGTNHRVSFRYLVQKIARDGKVRLKVWRGGQSMALDVPVGPDRPTAVPALNGAYPPYFIYGPLSFTVATDAFLGNIGAVMSSGPGAALAAFSLMSRSLDRPAFPGEEIVLVSSPFFPHKLAVGYSPATGRQVKTVNGVAVKNLRHLVEMLRDCRQEMVVFEFAGHGFETMVFPHKEMLAATAEILSDNDIRSRGSPDTLAVWDAKPER
jgi:S1-C subfamily serine protease